MCRDDWRCGAKAVGFGVELPKLVSSALSPLLVSVV